MSVEQKLTVEDIHTAIRAQLDDCICDEEMNVISGAQIQYIESDVVTYITLDNGQQFEITIKESK